MLGNFLSRSGICRGTTRRTLFNGVVEGTMAARAPMVGSYLEVKHAFDQTSVNTFAGLCGDNNPLHIDREFASTTHFGEPIVHGILVSSLVSTIFGRTINGSIYVNQTLSFRKPVFVDAEVRARMTIKSITPKKRGDLLTCSTEFFLADGSLAIDGEAQVLVPSEISIGGLFSDIFSLAGSNRTTPTADKKVDDVMRHVMELLADDEELRGSFKQKMRKTAVLLTLMNDDNADGETVWVFNAEGVHSATSEDAQNAAAFDVSVQCSESVFHQMCDGVMTPEEAWANGVLKVKGKSGGALKLKALLNIMHT